MPSWHGGLKSWQMLDASGLGLLIATGVWVGVLQLIAWTWNRHVLVMADSDIRVDKGDRHMTIDRVARYHSLGWTAAFLVFFALLELADFPLWQLLGFAGLLALVYGTSAIARGQNEWVGKDDPASVALFGQRRDAAWYRALMVTEWAAYLASIVLAAHLIMSLIT